MDWWAAIALAFLAWMGWRVYRMGRRTEKVKQLEGILKDSDDADQIRRTIARLSDDELDEWLRSQNNRR